MRSGKPVAVNTTVRHMARINKNSRKRSGVPAAKYHRTVLDNHTENPTRQPDRSFATIRLRYSFIRCGKCISAYGNTTTRHTRARVQSVRIIPRTHPLWGWVRDCVKLFFVFLFFFVFFVVQIRLILQILGQRRRVRRAIQARFGAN